MFAYSIDLSNLRELQEALRRAPQMVIEELEKAVTEADLHIEKELKDRIFESTKPCKYPPAKPGALICEPLEAA